ncbi:DUF2382 domain-containing protein [Lichenicola sp.]|uniref:DUF2382 domain-containing protein n=1 Tax=Lichenicola sp. TaxID=2804529 RepID=UPI003B008791
MRLHAERLEIERRVHETGQVRVATVTRTRQQTVDETLASEHVDIEHVEIGRLIDEVPDIRQEGDTLIIPVVEEVAVVVRRLRLTKEVRITRVRSVRHHHEVVELRAQEAVVTRSPVGTSSHSPAVPSEEEQDAH